jgi:DNA-binding transcriptional regulator LsrR (DeoR family)
METKKGVVWMYPELDIEELYLNGQFELLVQVANENIDLLVSHYRNANDEALEKSVRIGNVMASYFERGVQDDKTKALIALGKLIGCIETLEKIQYEKEQNRAVLERAKSAETENLDQVLAALFVRGYLSQDQMCEMLNLKEPAVDEVLEKALATNLIRTNPRGENQVYFLTEEGYRYIEMMRRKLTTKF